MEGSHLADQQQNSSVGAIVTTRGASRLQCPCHNLANYHLTLNKQMDEEDEEDGEDYGDKNLYTAFPVQVTMANVVGRGDGGGGGALQLCRH